MSNTKPKRKLTHRDLVKDLVWMVLFRFGFGCILAAFLLPIIAVFKAF